MKEQTEAETKNWKDESIQSTLSKSKVTILSNPSDNLITTNISPWPPPEIVQKLFKSRWSIPEEKNECEEEKGIGYSCGLQSINSEDAITWSVFGTISHAQEKARSIWLKDFLNLLGLPAEHPEQAHFFLWRRIPHPETLVSSGPEIDFGVISDKIVLLGEAKWNSAVGKNQGKKKNKDQIQLRLEFLHKFKDTVFPKQTIRAVTVIHRSAFNKDDYQCDGVPLCSATWEEVCAIKSHPLYPEVESYYKWKCELSSKKKGK